MYHSFRGLGRFRSEIANLRENINSLLDILLTKKSEKPDLILLTYVLSCQ